MHSLISEIEIDDSMSSLFTQCSMNDENFIREEVKIRAGGWSKFQKLIRERKEVIRLSGGRGY